MDLQIQAEKLAKEKNELAQRKQILDSDLAVLEDRKQRLSAELGINAQNTIAMISERLTTEERLANEELEGAVSELEKWKLEYEKLQNATNQITEFESVIPAVKSFTDGKITSLETAPVNELDRAPSTASVASQFSSIPSSEISNVPQSSKYDDFD